MPVVTFRHTALCQAIGKDVPQEELLERMPMIGGDLDSVDGDQITMEWFPDRPDLLTLEGTGRAMAAFLGHKTGIPSYDVRPPQTELRLDDAVADVRPHAGLCFVRQVPIDDDYLQLLIDAQEKLTMAPGRRRRKIAIGLHDAGDLRGPFQYTAVGPDDKPFVPLQGAQAMTPGKIIQEHPKGREYGHLLLGPGEDEPSRFPVFIDGDGDILSMPPVINAQKTSLTAQSRDVLIDVTGTDPQSVRRTIALLATSLADRGGTIEAVSVHDASGSWVCPELAPSERVLHTDDVAALLGIQLSGDEAAACLQRMGHDVEAFENKLLVHTPPWRFDILHPVDLMEDIAIGYGFDHFPGELPRGSTFGTPLPIQRWEERARALLIGLGWHEARTLTLSNEEQQWTRWGSDVAKAVTVENPVMEEQTLLRQRVAPSLLAVLAKNKHRNLPQRLFEVGYVVDPEGHNRLHAAGVEMAAKVGFSEAKGLAEALLRDLAIEDGTLNPGDRPGFIEGRSGHIRLGGKNVGHFGELHPDTLVAFDLAAPAIAFELDLDAVHEGA